MMKILIVVLLFSCIQLSAQSPELIEPKDNTNQYNFHCYLFCGLGIGSDQEIYPAMDFGVELSLFNAHIAAIEIESLFWFKDKGNYHLTNSEYFATVLSTSLKIYLNHRKNKLRPSLKFGYIFSPKVSVDAMGIGFNINYRINTTYNIELSCLQNIGLSSKYYFGQVFPTFYLINVHYKL